MFGIVTAGGKTKEEIILKLKHAVLFLEQEFANNFIGMDEEADIFTEMNFIPMGSFLSFDESGNKLQTK